MLIFKTATLLHDFITKQRSANRQTIGFVPTMGGLHDGHLALVKAAKQKQLLTICSIFINPTQFNDPEDYRNYPVTLEHDIYLLEKEGADILFLPSVDQLYPDGTENLEQFNLGGLDKVFEGKSRPGHFQGVCQVVYRLLKTVLPDILFLGQKDYQQCMVIKKMVDSPEIPFNLSIEIIPTVREKSGLAMSSRNMRLSETQKEDASSICRSLDYIHIHLTKGGVQDLINSAKQMMINHRLKPDYLEIADAHTLEKTDNWDGKQSLVALVAAYCGKIRLIDNKVIS